MLQNLICDSTPSSKADDSCTPVRRTTGYARFGTRTPRRNCLSRCGFPIFCAPKPPLRNARRATLQPRASINHIYCITFFIFCQYVCFIFSEKLYIFGRFILYILAVRRSEVRSKRQNGKVLIQTENRFERLTKRGKYGIIHICVL